jgi:hypothetical protein
MNDALIGTSNMRIRPETMRRKVSLGRLAQPFFTNFTANLPISDYSAK